MLGPTDELLLSRQELTWLLAARTGHGDYAKYHQRFHPGANAPSRCSCGHYKTPAHVLFCPLAPGPWGGSNKTHVDRQLGFLFREFLKRIRASRFYTTICPWQRDDTDNNHPVLRPGAIRHRLQEGYVLEPQARRRARSRRRRPPGVGSGTETSSSGPDSSQSSAETLDSSESDADTLETDTPSAATLDTISE